MKKELEHFLVRRFPDFFENCYKSPQESAMCFGFECGDGWFHLLLEACALIEHHINGIKETNELNLKFKAKIENGEEVYSHWTEKYKKDGLAPIHVPKFTATQVKEKFGTLRFYYNGGDDFIDGVVSFAEGMSSEVCEDCGNKGKTRHGGWVRTLCDKHAQDRKPQEPRVLIVDDEIYALSDGATKKYVIKEVLPDSFLAKETSETYNEDIKDSIKQESVEIYTIKKHVTDLFSYYEAIKKD